MEYAVPGKQLMQSRKELLSLIQQGKQVVLDFSFWNKANRAYYKRLIEKAGGTPELVYMKASKGTLQKRLDKRNQSLNANSPFIITNEILEHHYNDFQEPCISSTIKVMACIKSYWR